VTIGRTAIEEFEAHRYDDVMLRSTTDPGHALNLGVVAEGVELASSRQAWVASAVT
jgi:EAL domain-containing protein (putative c-di-GMP-specific phosphodiesterase class I)